MNVVGFFFVENYLQCIKVTHIQNLDKYMAQCYGKDRMINNINLIYFIINLIDLVSNVLLTK